MGLRTMIDQDNWRLPVVLVLLLAMAQIGKQSALAALDQRLPPIGMLVFGAITLMPLGLCVWTGIAWVIVNLLRPNSHFSWRAAVTIYLIASLSHVLYTAAWLLWQMATGSFWSSQLPFLRGPIGWFLTIENLVALGAFGCLTSWYVRGREFRKQPAVFKGGEFVA